MTGSWLDHAAAPSSAPVCSAMFSVPWPANQVADGLVAMADSMDGSRPSLGFAADQTAALFWGLT